MQPNARIYPDPNKVTPFEWNLDITYELNGKIMRKRGKIKDLFGTEEQILQEIAILTAIPLTKLKKKLINNLNWEKKKYAKSTLQPRK